MIHKSAVATVNDLPVSLFKIVGKEVRNKQKVYNALSSLIEDLYEAENSLGRSLLRIGSVPLGYKTDVIMCGVSSLWSNMYKSSTQLIGKQHCNLSVTVVQNICKVFPEHAKSNIKAIQAIVSKIDAQLEDHRRSVKSYQKYYDKYAKLALDIELAVKNRNNASIELEQQSNKSVNHDKDASLSLAASSSSSSAAKYDSQNEGFINTIKILTKNTPADVQKRLNDRCRDLVKDFDAAESILMSHSKKLIENEQLLMHDIEKAIAKLDDMETSRMKMLREGLNRLYLAEHLLVQRLEEIIDPLKGELSTLDIAAEFVDVLSFIDKPIDKESGTLSADNEGGNADKSYPANTDSVAVFSRLDNISSSLEFFKLILSREITITQEFAEAERIYSRSIGRALEKNGYGRNGGSNATLHHMTCAEMLASFESPSIRLGWETSINVFDSFSELHNNAADVYSSTIMKALESLYNKIDVTKKDLIEVQTTGMKNIENAQHMVSKLSKKLVKTKGLLTEKREAMRQAREDVANESSVNPSSEFGTEDSNLVVNNDPNSGSNNIPKKRNQGQEAMLQGIEKLGTSFRATNLSVGLGLETAPERVVRIEAKVSSLESDETELTKSVQDAIVKLDAVSETAKNEAMAIASICKAVIEESLTECKTIMELVIDIFLKNIQTSKNNVYLLKQSCEGIEIDVDKLCFYESMIQISESIKSGNADLSSTGYDYTALSLDLTPFQPFESLDNKLIIDERNSLGMSKISASDIQSIPFSKDLVSSSSIDQKSNTTDPKQKERNHCLDNSDVDIHKVGIFAIATELKLSSEDSTNAIKASVAAPAAPVPSLEITKHITANHFETINTPLRQNGSLSPTSTSKEAYDLQASSANSVLAQFGLNGQDKILESYVCALYPKKGFLVQGRMYVTQSYVAFSGWPETRVLLPMSSLVAIEKMNTLNFIPNAIMLRTVTDEFFFGSFIDRDPCHALLVSMSSVAKRIVELHGSDLENTSSLVFGYQTAVKQNLLAAIGLDIGDFDLLSESKSPTVNQLSQITPNEISSLQKGGFNNANNSNNNNGKTDGLESLSKVTRESDRTETTLGEYKSTKGDNINQLTFADKYSSTFAKHNIILLHEQVVTNSSAKELYDNLWSTADGYENFLLSEGDLNISTSEWVDNVNVKVRDDPTGISFTETRSFEYAHPRTSMLMFGPKNAPTIQAHYLHIDSDNGDDISSFVLLTITQFDGIPLSDCFKIYQYWICEDSKPSGSCITRIGMFVNIMKATLFKAQIIAGSKEELTVMCERWGRYAINRLEEHVSLATPEKAVRRSIGEPPSSSTQKISTPSLSSRSKPRRISKDVFSSIIDEISPEKIDKSNSKEKKISSGTRNYCTGVTFVFLIIIIYGQYKYNQSLTQLIGESRAELDFLSRLVQTHESMLRDINKAVYKA